MGVVLDPDTVTVTDQRGQMGKAQPPAPGQVQQFNLVRERNRWVVRDILDLVQQ